MLTLSPYKTGKTGKTEGGHKHRFFSADPSFSPLAQRRFNNHKMLLWCEWFLNGPLPNE
jgi:hypothetical protein